MVFLKVGSTLVDPSTGEAVEYPDDARVAMHSGELYVSSLAANGDYPLIDMAEFSQFEFEVTTLGSGVSFQIAATVSQDETYYKPEAIMTVRVDDTTKRGAGDVVVNTGNYTVNGRGGKLKFTLSSLAGSGSPSVKITGRGTRQAMQSLRGLDGALVVHPHAPISSFVGDLPVAVSLDDTNAVSGNGYTIAAAQTGNLANAINGFYVSNHASTTAVVLEILAGGTRIFSMNVPAGVNNEHVPNLLVAARGGSLNVRLSGDPSAAIRFNCQPFRVPK